MAWETIILEDTEVAGTVKLTINRPKALNALNQTVLKELKAAVAQIEADDRIKIVIITGAGEKSFVAGADISELKGLINNAPAAYALARNGQTIYQMIEESSKVYIAAVNGFALGGGCELSMSCDMRIAIAKAKFGVPEVSLGTVPGYGGTQRLPRLVGEGRAKEIAFTAKHIPAQRAYEIGLVNQVVETYEELMPAALELAKSILKNSIFAVGIAKKCIHEGLQMDVVTGIQHEASLFCQTYNYKDTEEGIGAFLEKRKPHFNAD